MERERLLSRLNSAFDGQLVRADFEIARFAYLRVARAAKHARQDGVRQSPTGELGANQETDDVWVQTEGLSAT